MVKKKKSLTIRTLKLIGKGAVLGGKGIYHLGKGAYKLSRKGVKSTKNTIEEGKRPKIQPNYQELSEIHTLNGSLESFEEKILKNNSLIGIILGARGTGKTAIGLNLLENIKAKTGRPVFALGFNKKDLPRWINVVEAIESVPNNSFLLVDEAGITFSSRDSMSKVNKMLSSLLFVARHKNLSLMMISQNSSNIEVNALRQADFLLLKPSSLLQKDFERKKIREVYDSVEELFKEYSDISGLCYIYSPEFQGFVSNPLPSFWSDDVSRAYSGFGK